MKIKFEPWWLFLRTLGYLIAAGIIFAFALLVGFWSVTFWLDRLGQ